MNNNPIGIFDSGLGGLTVWREIRQQLPTESIIYFADSKHCPYGRKPAEEIIVLASRIVDNLIDAGCKLIVVACNTATAAAIDYLRRTYNVPFVGMEPAIKQAALHTKTGKVGVLATKGTFDGKLYKSTSEKYASNVDVMVQIGDGLVEMVEANKFDTPEGLSLIMSYITPMVEHGVDQIVLGCTHYPFFKPQIEKCVSGAVTVIDPAPAVAKRVVELMSLNNLYSDGQQTVTDVFASSSSVRPMLSLLQGIANCQLTAGTITLGSGQFEALTGKTSF